MADIIVREASQADVAAFAAQMRVEDAEEVWALCRLSGYEGLVESYKNSKECYLGLLDGKVFCIFGVVPGEEQASVWMMFVKNIECLPLSFFRKSREYLDGMLRTYGKIGNYVRVENIFILKWLAWLGFTIEVPASMGIDNVFVCRFWKEG